MSKLMKKLKEQYQKYMADSSNKFTQDYLLRNGVIVEKTLKDKKEV